MVSISDSNKQLLVIAGILLIAGFIITKGKFTPKF